MITKIIAVDKIGNKFSCFGIKGDNYIDFEVAENKEEINMKYPKNNYRDYEHFVGVMSKFNPYTFFFKNYELIESYDDLKQLYELHNKA